MGKRPGFRAILSGTSVAALCALTACAPAQPPPKPGGAPLSADSVVYDNPEFLTNRAPVFPAGQECTKITGELLQRFGLKLDSRPTQNTTGNIGCELALEDGRIIVTGSPLPFADYWTGAVTMNEKLGTPGGSNFGKPPGNFSRKILAGKYYAAQYTTDVDTSSGRCHTVVDTGSGQPLIVTAYPYSDKVDPLISMNKPITLQELQRTHCQVTEKFAARLLREVDPTGGSRAQ